MSDPRGWPLAFLLTGGQVADCTSAARLESGLSFRLADAKRLGATRDDVVNAVLAGLPAAGNAVIQALPIALAAYDRSQDTCVRVGLSGGKIGR